MARSIFGAIAGALIQQAIKAVEEAQKPSDQSQPQEPPRSNSPWGSRTDSTAQAAQQPSGPRHPAPSGLSPEIQRIVEAHNEKRDQSNPKAQLKDDFAVAEALLANLPGSVEFLDNLAARSGARKGKIIEVKPLKPAERAAWFDCLVRLRAAQLWTRKWPEGFSYRLIASTPLGETSEWVLRELLEAGFEFNQPRAATVLEMLATRDCDKDLKGTAGSEYRSKLNAIRDLEAAVRKGLVLTAADRETARQLIALIKDVPDHRKSDGPETQDSPILKQLRAIAGEAAQDSFFQRMQGHEAPAVVSFTSKPASPAHAGFWRDAVIEALDIHRAFMAYIEDRSRTEPWMVDRTAFAARFGRSDGPGVLDFGWWLRNTKGEPGFPENHTNHISGRISGESYNTITTIPVELAHEMHARGEAFMAALPRSYGSPAIPALQAFTFDGRDPQGELFSLFEKVKDSVPGPTWYKAVDACIARIGREDVLAFLETWLRDYLASGIAR